jgi:aspartate/methionine/tyrosine aminotransferase
VGSWLLSDEVYRGAELSGKITPSFWGMYDKVIINSGLSKALTLPGLRIGWAIGPEDFVEEIWHHSDYTTITVGAVSDRLAILALRPEIQQKIFLRNREIANTNLAILQDWLSKYPGLFNLTPPSAGGIAFFRYNLDINSTDLVMQLIKEKSVFLVPGDCFDMDHFIRIGFGVQKSTLLTGLHLFGELIKELQTG